MRTSLDFLPLGKQRELERAVEILHLELAEAIALSSTQWKRQGRITKIILYGSYAKAKWIDEPHTKKGYQSDYDLLVIVNHDKLTDPAAYWYKAEDRLHQEPSIKPIVNFIVHTLDEVNDALRQGQYFFSDIIDEGIALYEAPKSGHFTSPQPLSPIDAHQVAQKHFDQWLPSARGFHQLAGDAVKRQLLKEAAFLVHQAVERTYTCLQLVFTNYSPNSHNIKFLRNLAEQLDEALIDAWPRDTRLARSRFENLKRAYVEARYSEHYQITDEDVKWLMERTEHLQSLTERKCLERLDALQREVANS